MADGARRSRATPQVGTTCYMAPERLSGEQYSYSSDIWSLGLVVARLLGGAVAAAVHASAARLALASASDVVAAFAKNLELYVGGGAAAVENKFRWEEGY